MDVLAVIPARLYSTRLPRKALIKIDGKPLIQHVYEGVQQSKLVTKLIVATDSGEISDCVHSFNGEVMMTSTDHKTGTDRVAEVSRKFPDFPIVINIQGDILYANGQFVDDLIKPLIENNEIKMSALKSQITVFYKNMGVYGFRRDFLLEHTLKPQTILEKAESLEQLRALENGVKIYVTETYVRTIDINTPKDLEKVDETKKKTKEFQN
jgi:3-deoxy-manno-octulosonate cytidylyltransferase (CMP-KDO synthetase)